MSNSRLQIQYLFMMFSIMSDIRLLVSVESVVTFMTLMTATVVEATVVTAKMTKPTCRKII